MKILIDMNLSPMWVQFLVSHGIEAVHWSTIGDASVWLAKMEATFGAPREAIGLE